MKTKDELKALKAQVEALKAKLAELTEEEQSVVFGGIDFDGNSSIDFDNNSMIGDDSIEGGIIYNRGGERF